MYPSFSGPFGAAATFTGSLDPATLCQNMNWGALNPQATAYWTQQCAPYGGKPTNYLLYGAIGLGVLGVGVFLYLR